MWESYIHFHTSLEEPRHAIPTVQRVSAGGLKMNGLAEKSQFGCRIARLLSDHQNVTGIQLILMWFVVQTERDNCAFTSIFVLWNAAEIINDVVPSLIIFSKLILHYEMKLKWGQMRKDELSALTHTSNFSHRGGYQKRVCGPLIWGSKWRRERSALILCPKFASASVFVSDCLMREIVSVH